ncbi:MAG TPA: HYR domain-containing protein [Saprospiraceae bacterium]|nr:HYR domain-containing protein [Saprospiraceae bacterium]
MRTALPFLHTSSLACILILSLAFFGLTDVKAQCSDPDTEAPTITCPEDITAFVDAGTCCAAVSVASPTGTDNCPNISFTNDYNGTDNASDMYFTGESIVTWTVTDASGLTATCEQRVTVVDNEAPVLGYTDEACIAEYESCLAEQEAIIAELEEELEEFIANCNGEPRCLKQAEQEAKKIDEQARKRFIFCLRILNNCEIIPAENNLLPDIVVEVEAGSCEAQLNPGPVVMENCTAFTLTNDYNGTGSGEGMYPVGTTNVTWTAVDQYGNTSTVSRSITVLDLISPEANCQDVTVQLDEAGTATVTALEIDNGSNDNCPGLDLAIISGQTSFNCQDVGRSFDLELEVTDNSGNQASCTATVTVSASELPDTDCDGIVDACDVCPGGDDSLDANGDGIPDCSQLLSYAEYDDSWKCKKKKINICHKGKTLCISKNALSAHFNHGDAVGPCQSCGDKKLNLPTGQSVDFPVVLDGELEMSMFPNPANTELTLDLHGMEEANGEFSIFDLTGKKFLSQELAAGTHILNIDLPKGLFAPGLYIVRVVSADKMISKRLIIQH